MLRGLMLVTLFFLCANAVATEPPARDPMRGELLYANHCIACHNSQVHWRQKKVVSDWSTLLSEVRRWQGVAGLGWRDEDTLDVARYLNSLYYRFPPPA